jgi:gliding motility-associated-like protein
MVMSICKGDSIVFGNSVYRDPGTYLKKFQTFHGCDSMVQLQLHVLPEISGAQDRIVCAGDSLQFNLTGGIQYEWLPATGLSCTNCPNPVASPADDIIYVIRVMDIHQCVDFDTIHVDVSRVDVSLDISDHEVCEGEAVAFSEIFNSDFPFQSRMWDFGDGFLSTNSNPVHAYFDDSVYNVNLTITDSEGCSDSADTTITVHPRPDIVLSSDTAICIGDSVQLNAYGADSYAWLPVDYLNAPNVPNPSSRPDSNITYYVAGVSSNGCLNHAAVSITVNPLPELHVSNDAAVCPNGSAVIYASGGTEYSWYPPKWLSDANSQFVIAAPQASTTYRVIAVNEFGCHASDSVHVQVYPKTEFKVSPNGEICKGDMMELAASGGRQYRWTPPYGLSCVECERTIASPGVTTKYAVAATDTYGCKYDDSVSVLVKEFPIVRTIPDRTICKGESVLLETVAANLADFSWSPESYLDNTQIINPIASPESSITYVVSVTNDLGCSVSDSVRLNVINKVDADLTGSPACPGERVQLRTTVNDASENGYQIQWLPASLFDDLHAATQTLRPVQDLEISAIVTSQTCEADTLSYFINLHDVPEVDAGEDKIVYLGENVPLAASSNSIINYYSWSPSNRLECGECQSTTWMADRSQTFAVNVVDENGCAAKDSVTFRVVGDCRDDVFVPNAFTPNGDEINDRFLVRSQNQIKLNHFKIFDRWGKEVYSSSDIEEGWDGNHKDKEAFSGVYVYHLIAGCRNGQSVLVKGNVTVIR